MPLRVPLGASHLSEKPDDRLSSPTVSLLYSARSQKDVVRALGGPGVGWRFSNAATNPQYTPCRDAADCDARYKLRRRSFAPGYKQQRLQPIGEFPRERCVRARVGQPSSRRCPNTCQRSMLERSVKPGRGFTAATRSNRMARPSTSLPAARSSRRPVAIHRRAGFR